jgi:hypothetical protein
MKLSGLPVGAIPLQVSECIAVNVIWQPTMSLSANQAFNVHPGVGKGSELLAQLALVFFGV